MRHSLLTGAGAAILALGLAGCSSTKPVAEETSEFKIKPIAERQEAPSFDLKDANGGSVKLTDFKGRVLLMNFWATWCVPCKAEIPWFQEFEKTYSDRGFSVLGVSLDEDGWKVVSPYVDERKISYKMVLGTEQLSAIYGGIDSLPTTFIIDGEGKIAAIHNGLVSKETYRKEIEDLLEAKHGQVRGPGAGELAMFRAASVRAE